jgi:hypothetical protein
MFLGGMVQSTVAHATIQSADYSPYLHNVILAVAALNAPEYDMTRRTSGMSLSETFAQHASEMLPAELDCPTTTTVRATMLLGSCLFYNLQRNRGWLYVVQGSRIAQLRK